MARWDFKSHPATAGARMPKGRPLTAAQKIDIYELVEDGADRVYQNALRRLFAEEEGGKEVVTWLRIFDRMEYCLNACDRAAGVVRSVVMKSA